MLLVALQRQNKKIEKFWSFSFPLPLLMWLWAVTRLLMRRSPIFRRLLKMWIFLSRFFNRNLLGPPRVITYDHWEHLNWSKGAPFGLLKILIFDFGFEQKKICDFILALTWPFFIGIWLGIPQNDRTDSHQKMAYSRSLSDQLIISNKAGHFQTLGPKNSM